MTMVFASREADSQSSRRQWPRRSASSSRAIYQGFTLIELMVTLAVLAIALSIGVPTYQSLTAQSSISSAGNDLLAALALARSEALKRDATVSLQAVSAEVSDTLGAGYCVVVGNPGNCSGSLIRRFGVPLLCLARDVVSCDEVGDRCAQ